MLNAFFDQIEIFKLITLFTLIIGNNAIFQ